MKQQKRLVSGLGAIVWSVGQCWLSGEAQARTRRDRTLEPDTPAPIVLAQMAPDTTLPDDSRIRTDGTRTTIEGGSTRGRNLFHSFREFSVPTGMEAFFDNAASIENIVTRVTGSNLSAIDGTIAANGTANLFLLNPNGIIFGENASLAIGGSFFATTAESLVFADGFEFSAIAPETPPLLTISVPIGLQMGQMPGAIAVRGTGMTEIVPTDNFGLTVAPGQTLALIGGEIELDGGIVTAPSGQIEIGSVREGRISFSATPLDFQFNYDEVSQWGNVALFDRSSLFSPAVVPDLNSAINVTGGNILLESSQIVTLTDGNTDSGAIAIRAADALELRGMAPTFPFSAWIATQVTEAATGRGGDIDVSAGQVAIENGARIQTLSAGAGAAGEVTVEASESVRITGFALVDIPDIDPSSRGNIDTRELLEQSLHSRISSENLAEGTGGNIRVSTGEMTLLEGGQVVTLVGREGLGNGGNVTVRAETIAAERVSISNPLVFSGIGSHTLGDAAGGQVEVFADNVTLLDGAEIFSFAQGSGNGGDIILDIADTLIAIELNSQVPSLHSGIGSFTLGSGDSGKIDASIAHLELSSGARLTSFGLIQLLGATVPDAGTGRAGNVTVRADTMNLVGGSSLILESLTQLGSVSFGSGDGGDVDIFARTIRIANGATIGVGTAFSFRALGEPVLGSGTGNTGNLTVNATESISVVGFNPVTNENSILAVGSVGLGNSGNLLLETPHLLLLDGGFLGSSTGASGDAGEVIVNATEIEIDGTRPDGAPSQIAGNTIILSESFQNALFLPPLPSGNIQQLTVNAENIAIANGGSINVQNPGSGDAGQLEINADRLELESGSNISAIAASGSGGDVEINVRDSLILRNGSEITTEALAGDGDGGNLDINAATIVGSNNSDITANASLGSGGEIVITTDGIFGFEIRTRDELVNLLGTDDPAQLDPRRLSTSDITAFSRENPNIDIGAVMLNTPEVDPSFGLENLPSEVRDVTPLLGDRCSATVGEGASSFSLTGRGGLPPSPYSILDENSSSDHPTLAEALELRSQGFYRRSLNLLASLSQSLANEPDSPLKAQVERHYAIALRLTGELNSSLEAFARAQKMAAALSSRNDFAATALGIGNTFKAQGNLRRARANYQLASALAPSANVPVLLNEFALSVETGRVARAIALRQEIEAAIAELPQNRAAIYAHLNYANNWLKLPDAERDPELRSLLAIALDRAAQLQDERAQSYVLGTLGTVFERSQQWEEAQQATQNALVLAENLNAPDLVYQWQWQLGRISNVLGETESAIAAYGGAVEALQSLRQDLLGVSTDVQFSFQNSVEPVYRQYAGLLLKDSDKHPDAERQQRLRTSLETLENLQLVELENFFQQACIPSEIAEIDEIDPKAAAIHAIVLDESIEVIASLPGRPLQHARVEVTRAEKEQIARELEQSLSRSASASAALQPASEIYNWLVRPFADQLQHQNIETLVFVLDDFLRNLPPSILHDGEQYLIEQYNVALTPGLQLLSSRQLSAPQIRGLLAGLAEDRQGFQPLPGVANEIASISEVISHKTLFNETFTESLFEEKIEQLPFNVIHLATHSQFSSRLEDTFILTWDGKIDVRELGDILRRRAISESEALELLVLSSCQTAAGDDRAVLGLAGVAVRSGARSTLATLWAVDDASTSLAMSEFYRYLSQPGATKAQALRRAQLELLNSQNYQHPFFWAPFVLVGNWQ